MNEEWLSERLFQEATSRDDVEVLSWQSVDGKGYFTADVKLRLSSGERMEPDLIVVRGDHLWLIEVKTRHSEAIDDEVKLVRLVDDLGEDEIRRQVAQRSRFKLENEAVGMAVAYVVDDVEGLARCTGATHICSDDVDGDPLLDCLGDGP